MTQKEANNILKKKHPQGYIRYSDIGRKAHINIVVLVSFTQHGKDYRYKGSYESVLIKLGCMEAPIFESTYKPENNIFLKRNW